MFPPDRSARSNYLRNLYRIIMNKHPAGSGNYLHYPRPPNREKHYVTSWCRLATEICQKDKAQRGEITQTNHAPY